MVQPPRSCLYCFEKEKETSCIKDSFSWTRDNAFHPVETCGEQETACTLISAFTKEVIDDVK